jgi:hypothetical protein
LRNGCRVPLASNVDDERACQPSGGSGLSNP